MPVIRVNNYIDAYRVRSQAKDIHELAGRPDKQALTEFVNRSILNEIQPGPDDILVDIGCGDGTLLRMAMECGAECLGITPTAEEKARLEEAMPKLAFKVGTVQDLPLKPESASKVVCNAVLCYLSSEEEVKTALQAMARIARPGATVWVGEIPEIDEYAHYGMYRGTSMPAFLWHLLTHNGLRSFLGMCRRWLKATLGSERIMLNSAGLFHAEPARMVALAEACGLRLSAHFRHKEMDQQGHVADSKFRYDYVFIR